MSCHLVNLQFIWSKTCDCGTRGPPSEKNLQANVLEAAPRRAPILFMVCLRKVRAGGDFTKLRVLQKVWGGLHLPCPCLTELLLVKPISIFLTSRKPVFHFIIFQWSCRQNYSELFSTSKNDCLLLLSLQGRNGRFLLQGGRDEGLDRETHPGAIRPRRRGGRAHPVRHSLHGRRRLPSIEGEATVFDFIEFLSFLKFPYLANEVAACKVHQTQLHTHNS